MAKKRTKTGDLPTGDGAEATLLDDLRRLIEETRGTVAQAVNSGQVLLYWRVGHRTLNDVLGSRRAAYGDEIVATVSRQLAAEYGRGFAENVSPWGSLDGDLMVLTPPLVGY